MITNAISDQRKIEQIVQNGNNHIRLALKFQYDQHQNMKNKKMELKDWENILESPRTCSKVIITKSDRVNQERQ